MTGLVGDERGERVDEEQKRPHKLKVIDAHERTEV